MQEQGIKGQVESSISKIYIYILLIRVLCLGAEELENTLFKNRTIILLLESSSCYLM